MSNQLSNQSKLYTIKRSLSDWYRCSVNTNSKWYACRKNNTKQKHETPWCEIRACDIGTAGHVSADALRPAQTRNHCCGNILCQCSSQSCLDEQKGQRQNIFCELCVFSISHVGMQTRKHVKTFKVFQKHFFAPWTQKMAN